MFSGLWLRYKNVSFHRKLLLSYVALLLIPILLLSLFTYQRSRQVIHDQALVLATQSTQRAADDLSALALSAHRIATILNQNTRVREIVEKDPANTPATEQIDDFRYLENLIESIRADSDAHSIRLYVPEGFLFANQGIVTGNLAELAQVPWFAHIPEIGNAMHFVPVEEQRYPLEQPVRVLPGIFPLYSMRQYRQIIGVIRVDYLEEGVQALMRGADFTETGGVYLFDEDGRVVTSFGALTGVPDFAGVQDAWQSIRLGGGEAMLRRLPLSMPGWTLGTVIPMQSLLREASQLQGQILAFALVLGVVIAFISWWTARYNSRRILTLARHMMRARDGDFSTRVVADSEDEIGMLQQSFNYLLAHTQSMMEEKYTLGQSLKGMELIALQNQINPHFLYNTLDLIYWSAKEGDAGRVASVVEELSKYYRLSLSQGKTFITLAEELRHVTHYVNIQNFRFQGRITLQMRVEEEIMDVPCLKLILQPIVENAILHGLLEREDKSGVIRISGERVGGDVVLKIMDDGIGIPPERIREIEQGERGQGKGYGIWNINQRLHLHYGEGSGLRYESLPSMGTVVTVTIPVGE